MTFICSIFYSFFCQFAQAICAVLASGFSVSQIDSKSLSFWFLLLSAQQFIMLLDFGIPISLGREIGFRLKGVQGFSSDTSSLIKSILIGNLYLILILPLSWIIDFCFIHISNDDQKICYYLFSMSILLRIYSNTLSSILIALNNNVLDKTIKMSSAIIFLLSVYFLYEINASIATLSVAWFLQSAWMFSVSFYCVFRSCNIREGQFSIESLKLLFFPAKKYLISAIPGVGIFNMSIYFAAFYLSHNQVVIISIVQQICFVLLSVTTLPMNIFFPRFSKLFINNKDRVDRCFGALYFFIVFNAAFAFSFIYIMKPYWSLYWLHDKVNIDNLFLLLFVFLFYLETQQHSLTSLLISSGFINFTKVSLLSVSLIFVFLNVTLYFGRSILYIPLVIILAQCVTCYVYSPFMVKVNINFSILNYYSVHLFMGAISVLLFLFNCYFYKLLGVGIEHLIIMFFLFLSFYIGVTYFFLKEKYAFLRDIYV